MSPPLIVEQTIMAAMRTNSAAAYLTLTKISIGSDMAKNTGYGFLKIHWEKYLDSSGLWVASHLAGYPRIDLGRT